MKNPNKYKFVRFGNLTPKKQKGFYTKERGYHTPPASKGFYAMPFQFQEFFLIGSLSDTQPDVFGKNKRAKFFEENKKIQKSIEFKLINDKLEYIYDTPEKKKFLKELKLIDKAYDDKYRKIRKEFIKKEGFVWHHLGNSTKTHEIIDRNGSWVKTTVRAWRKAVEKYFMTLAVTEYTKRNFYSTGYSIKIYSKDEFEVFFDEKI